MLLIANINPFKSLPQIRIPALRHPFANAFVYGLLYGPLTLLCSGPLVVSIFALSLTVGDALSRMSLFLWFGLGFGLPLLILSFLAGGLAAPDHAVVGASLAPDQSHRRADVGRDWALRCERELGVDQHVVSITMLKSEP